MEKKIKVIIADESAEFGQNCSNALKSYGMEVLLCAKDGRKLLDKINREKPDSRCRRLYAEYGYNRCIKRT